MSLDLFHQTAQGCSQLITRAYSTSFSLGIQMLAPRFRPAIYAIYAYVRCADELVDTFHEYNKPALLDGFRQDTYRAWQEGISLNPVIHAFIRVARQYSIEIELLDAFLDSMAMDLTQQTFRQSQYQTYVFGSAEVVGLMCLRVFCEGDEGQYEALLGKARRLGAAFQKVNFLRDMAADRAERGRLYFPGVDFSTFSVADKHAIEEDINDDFTVALAGVVQLPPGARFGVYVAYRYYLDLFSHLRKAPPQDLLTQRIRVSNPRKLWLLGRSFVRHFVFPGSINPARVFTARLLLLLLAGWIGLVPVVARPTLPGASLQVAITGLKPGQGAVLVALYNQPDSFPGRHPYRTTGLLPVTDSLLTYTFGRLPRGKYAVAVIYDLNRNGRLDTNWLGIPREPYGFSNDARSRLGPPSFDRAVVVVEANAVSTRVLLR